METLTNWEQTIDIEMIESIAGPKPEFEVIFLDSKRKRHKLIFNRVWDMRYSVENASIMRFCEFRKHLPANIIDNGIYVVKESEYIKYFKYQVDETLPTDELTHYILCDRTDTTIDILVDMHKPVLVSIE